MLEKILKNYTIITNDKGMKINLTNGIIKNKKFKLKIEDIYIGKENNKLKLTSVGINIIQFMLKKYPKYVDYDYTKNMEIYLNQI